MEAKKKTPFSNFFTNKKTVTFIFFLFFSATIWLLIKLSNDYQQNIEVSLKFYENDDQKIISNQNAEKASVLIKAKGFQLLKYNLTKHLFNVDISHLGNNKVKVDLASARYKNAMQNQLFKKSSILSINPEIITLTIDTLTSKKVPVKPQVQLIFRNGYQLRDSLSVSPPEITIYGPSEMLDTTAYVLTEYKSLEDLYTDFELNLNINTTHQKDLVYNNKKVEVKGKVERFSEQAFELPVRFINVPSGVMLKSFPQKIEVVCKGTLSVLKKITENDFDLICDYNKIDSTSTYVKTEMRTKPDQIEVIKVNDGNFQVLIRKKQK